MSIPIPRNEGPQTKTERRGRTSRLNLRIICGVALVSCATLIGSARPAMAQAGQLDPTFGNKGVVSTSNTGAVATAIQSDGKILVAGEARPGLS